jgi:hypothetical protein
VQLTVPRIYEQLKADALRVQQLHKGVAPSFKGRQRARGSLEALPTNQSQWRIVKILKAELVDAAHAWCGLTPVGEGSCIHIILVIFACLCVYVGVSQLQP